jgi:FtsZ-binding cell division protein ZapB
MKPTRTLPVQALLVVGLLSACLHAQSVGIGTATPHPSARLHISDNARGLLIPNVALTATNVAAPVTNPATSLLVYNTNTAGTGATAVSPGFYYWDGNRNQWVRLLGGGDAWLLTGNAGTDPAVNFLGTLDDQPLCIRVDNQETFRFNPPGAIAPAWSIQRGGGDPRGLHAVDLQSARAQATQVASGDYSVIGGGRNNTASSTYATVGGGVNNTASGNRATIGGGRSNTASGDDATVGGGFLNNASGELATVGGGRSNTASGNLVTVGGGEGNTASSYAATVGGGGGNTASGLAATVGGGANNTASGDRATVGGGWQNTASGELATVCGGRGNTASGSAFVGGGRGNTASGGAATIGGGLLNTASALYAIVGGGLGNTASSDYATVGGGWHNTASGGSATVGGGYTNTASGVFATVGGGGSNTASGAFSTVGGGERDTASGDRATVGGGRANTASGAFSTVGGGRGNTASGDFSVVPGGFSNTANANYNLVFGQNVDPSVTETHRVYFFGDGSDVNTPNPSGFLVINRLDGNYPIHVGTDNTNGDGAYLTTGGVWTNGSSRSFKERFVQYRPAEVLEKILQLPVEGYFYKGTEEYHITPMAEDFYRLFGTGVHEIIETDSTGQLVRRPNPDVDKYLAASDVAGVALLGIQALHEENAQLRQRVADLETENAQLRQQISDIRTENAALRARLERLETLMQRIASTQTNP